MAAPPFVPDQYSGSVNTNVPSPVVTSGGNVEDADSRVRNIFGTLVDTQPQPFPTVPASFDANRHFYPGLARSYLAASIVETAMHGQIQFATQDIPSVQLTIRGAISPQVIQRWQQSLTVPAAIPKG